VRHLHVCITACSRDTSGGPRHANARIQIEKVRIVISGAQESPRHGFVKEGAKPFAEREVEKTNRNTLNPCSQTGRPIL
jgi:hypothetical protein